MYRFKLDSGRKGTLLAYSGAQAAQRLAELLYGERGRADGLLFTGVAPKTGPAGAAGVMARQWRVRLFWRPTLKEEYFDGKREVYEFASIAEDAKPAAAPARWTAAPRRPAEKL